MPREPRPHDLVEPEGVNAGSTVDGGPDPAAGAPSRSDRSGSEDPEPDDQGQGNGELLSDPGSDNGVTGAGPGQEMSAGEG